MFKYPTWFINEVNKSELDKLASLRTTDKIQFYCPDHGTYIQRIGDHIKISTMERKGGCPKCRRSAAALRKKKYPDWFIEDLCEYEREGIYNHKSTDKVMFLCKEHGEYLQEIHEHIDGSNNPKCGCPKCGTLKASKSKSVTLRLRNPFTREFLDDLLPEFRSKIYDVKVTEKVPFVCKKHGVYLQRVYDHVNGHGCPDCKPYIYHSKKESEVKDYLATLGVTNIKENVRGSISDGHRTYELDLFLEDYNIGIEFNGSYWHSSSPNVKSQKDRLYHQSKFLSGKKRGVHVIQIFDVDWENKKDKIEQYLESLFKPSGVIYARKCSIVEISKKEANEFYSQNHLLGATVGNNCNYALTLGLKVVAVMSFSDSKYHGAYDWELVRFACIGSVKVVGGASRLFKHFLKNHNPKSIISYSDNDFFQGGVYQKLGFKEEGQSTPRYYWFKSANPKSIVRSRESCQLSKLAKEFPEDFEESSKVGKNREDWIMEKNGYLKVYRSGITKWVWTRVEGR